jgi:hypothetical protein
MSKSDAQSISGTYDIAGTAHVSVSPFPAHDYPGNLTATLSRTAAPGAFSLRIEGRGYGCTLPVRASEDGSLQFPETATCPLDIAQPDARGHVDAQLRTARGRVANGTLELVLQFDVNGSVQMKIPSKTIHIFGIDFQSPAGWAPTAPVRGTVAASGQGARKRPDAGTP